MLVYLLLGVFVGLVGMLWVGCYFIVFIELVLGYELIVIVVCVIGGVSIGGGVGIIVGVLFGVLFIGVINGVLLVIQVLLFWQQVIVGVVILILVVFNVWVDCMYGCQIFEIL